MEFFLNIDGQKVGPLTIYDVREKLRREQISPDTKAWVKGMEQWQPLRELDPLKESIEIHIADASDKEITISDQERTELGRQTILHNADKPRPWLRFWARLIDAPILLAPGLILIYQIFGAEVLTVMLVPAWVLAEPPSVIPSVTDWATLFVIIAASWTITETLLLTYFQKTPGKWCMNIRIQKENGEGINFSLALKRSAFVFVFGMGLGEPILRIACHIIAYLKLTREGETYWDKKCKVKIIHGSVNYLLVVALTLIIMYCYGLAVHKLLGEPELQQL